MEPSLGANWEGSPVRVAVGHGLPTWPTFHWTVAGLASAPLPHFLPSVCSVPSQSFIASWLTFHPTPSLSERNRPTVALSPAAARVNGWMCMRPSPCECSPNDDSNAGAFGSHVPQTLTPR